MNSAWLSPWPFQMQAVAVACISEIAMTTTPIHPNVLHWSFDPIAFAIGPVTIRWYGICWAIAFFSAEIVARGRLRSIGRSDVDVSSLTVCALIGTVVGARLTHCLFYEPYFYLSHPLKVFAIWEGGMASHGGALGFISGLAWGAPRYAPAVPLLTLLDVATVSAALGAAVIRIANFLNSEIVGIPTSGRWGVIFDSVDSLPRHPVQLYEAGAYLVIAALLAWEGRRDRALLQRGYLTGLFLALVFGTRAVLEFWKTPQATYEAGFRISVGQWLSVPFIVLGIGLMARARWYAVGAKTPSQLGPPSGDQRSDVR
jgi:phosphatidylglycerol:prolipoprotein diacylglycerol transferase